MIRPVRLSVLTAAIAVLAASPALAHVGTGPVNGLLAGLAHPIGGLDHLLAMVAVGVWGSQQGRQGRYALPAVFVAAMVAGGAAAMAGWMLPGVEAGIAASVVILGVAVALALRVPAAAGGALVAVFALFHGHAHGAEMAAGANAVTYAVGFVVATAALHAAGLGIGLLARHHLARLGLRIAGGATAAAGVAILAGV